MQQIVYLTGIFIYLFITDREDKISNHGLAGWPIHSLVTHSLVLWTQGYITCLCNLWLDDCVSHVPFEPKFLKQKENETASRPKSTCKKTQILPLSKAKFPPWANVNVLPERNIIYSNLIHECGRRHLFQLQDLIRDDGMQTNLLGQPFVSAHILNFAFWK